MGAADPIGAMRFELSIGEVYRSDEPASLRISLHKCVTWLQSLSDYIGEGSEARALESAMCDKKVVFSLALISKEESLSTKPAIFANETTGSHLFAPTQPFYHPVAFHRILVRPAS